MDTLGRCLSIFVKARAAALRLAFVQACATVATSILVALCASLFAFTAVNSYPMWPVWFHRVTDAIALSLTPGDFAGQ